METDRGRSPVLIVIPGVDVPAPVSVSVSLPVLVIWS